MRPARKGPENPPSRPGGATARPRFNEAGPQGAGKPYAAVAETISHQPLQ